MDYNAAIASLEKLEGATELASVVRAEVQRLTDKNFDVIGENRTATTKVRALEQSLDAIASTLGISGEDLESKLANAPEKVRSLSTQLSDSTSKASAAETRASDAETKLTGLERKATVAQAAAKAGVVAEVLERLLGDRVSDLKIEGDEVKLDDKLLRDFVEADESLRAFIPALFPQTQEQTTQARLPGGTPNGQTTPNAADQAYERATGRSPDADTSWVGGQK